MLSGSRDGFADQPPTATLADSDMTEHAPRWPRRPEERRASRDRIVVPVAPHHQMLEQAPDRSDPPVHRRRRRALSLQRHDHAARPSPRACCQSR